MKSSARLLIWVVTILFACNNKEPYQPPAYQAKGFVIGEEKCSVDSNYNYWLFDLSIENTSGENGDTITYNGIKYYHVFKAATLNPVLHKPGNKVEFDFNFSTSDKQKIQGAVCDAPDAATFLLIPIYPFNEKQLN